MDAEFFLRARATGRRVENVAGICGQCGGRASGTPPSREVQRSRGAGKVFCRFGKAWSGETNRNAGRRYRARILTIRSPECPFNSMKKTTGRFSSFTSAGNWPRPTTGKFSSSTRRVADLPRLRRIPRERKRQPPRGDAACRQKHRRTARGLSTAPSTDCAKAHERCRRRTRTRSLGILAQALYPYFFLLSPGR